MTVHKTKTTTGDELSLRQNLEALKLSAFLDNYSAAAQQAAEKQWSYADFLGQLAEAEVNARNDRSTQRRIKQARFPVLKTLDTFNCFSAQIIRTTPAQINYLLFFHGFVPTNSDVVNRPMAWAFISWTFSQILR
jgi:DNA replication protein DnaC